MSHNHPDYSLANEMINEALLVSTITTNLIGPILMAGLLIEHFKKRDQAYVINVSSALGFVPLAMAAMIAQPH